MSCNSTIRIYAGDITECDCLESTTQVIPSIIFEDSDNPLNSEIATWYFDEELDLISGTLFILIGDGTISEPDYVWSKDSNNDFTLIQSPSSSNTGINLSEWAASSVYFNDVNNPLISEVQNIVNDNNLTSGTFITYQGTADEPHYVWAVIEDDNVLEIKNPSFTTAVQIPNEEFDTPSAPYVSELNDYIDTNNLAVPGNIFVVAGDGTVNQADNVYVYLENGQFSKLNHATVSRIIYNIPEEAFNDPDAPETEEVDEYLSSQLDLTLEKFDIAIYEGNGSYNYPDYVWILGDGYQIIQIQSPGGSISGGSNIEFVVLPLGTFADQDYPLYSELTTYISTYGPFSSGTYLLYLGTHGTPYNPAFIWVMKEDATPLLLTKSRLDYTVLSGTSNPNEIEISYPNGSTDMISINASADYTALENKLEILQNQLSTMTSLVSQLVLCQCGVINEGDVDIGLSMLQTGSTLPTADLVLTSDSHVD